MPRSLPHRRGDGGGACALTTPRKEPHSASAFGDELKSIQPWLTLVQLRSNVVLHEQGGPIEHIYFPLSGMVSLLAIMQSGEAIETGIVGADGLLGGDAPVNGHLFGQATVQMDGAALTMPKAQFLDAYNAHPHLRNLVNRYQSILLMQAQQNAACHALHSVRNRLCRWMLQSQDMIGSDTFILTQATSPSAPTAKVLATPCAGFRVRAASTRRPADQNQIRHARILSARGTDGRCRLLGTRAGSLRLRSRADVYRGRSWSARVRRIRLRGRSAFRSAKAAAKPRERLRTSSSPVCRQPLPVPTRRCANYSRTLKALFLAANRMVVLPHLGMMAIVCRRSACDRRTRATKKASSFAHCPRRAACTCNRATVRCKKTCCENAFGIARVR